MSDSKIHLRIPTDFKRLITDNIDNHKLESNGIVLHTYDEDKFESENNGGKVIEKKELYSLMVENFGWLLDFLANDVQNEDKLSKFNSKLGYMLGINGDYLDEFISLQDQTFKSRLENIEDNTSKTTKKGSIFKKKGTKLFNGKNNHKDKENFEDFDFSSVSGNLNVFDNLKKILENLPNPPDFKDTLMYQYMKPRSGPFVDTSQIEKNIFSHPYDKDLGNSLKNALERSSLEDFVKLVKHYSNGHYKVEMENIRNILTWKSWLINGFHLVFTGIGSKRNILKLFCNSSLKYFYTEINTFRDGPNLKINAYTIKGSDSYLWNYLNEKIVGSKCSSKSVAFKRVYEKVGSLDCNFYFIIYGLDNFVINDGFKTLKSLLRLRNVKIVGDINYQNLGVLMNELDRVLGKYRIINVDTHHDYTQELISIWQNNPPNILVDKKSQRSLSQIKSILEALSQNHQKLFSLIAQIQIENLKNNKKFIGIEKNSILQDPRAITICHNESKLDNLLTEFTTHEVIEQTRGPGGRLFLKIPFET